MMSGDGDWGIVNSNPKPNWMSFLPDWMWAFKFPHNVNNDGIPIPGCVGRWCHELPEAVYPTSFYETIMAIILFGVLWAIRKRITTPGLLFSIYLILNGAERFLIESIRVNTQYHILGLGITQAQIISSSLIILGIVGIWFTRNSNKNKFHASA
jgi:prolipoprotein diacylglyceryltransferase